MCLAIGSEGFSQWQKKLNKQIIVAHPFTNGHTLGREPVANAEPH